MSKKMEEFKLSNVFKLVFICAVTMLAVFVLRGWYLKAIELEQNTPILLDVLTHQIKSNELYNYVRDADTTVVYMCSSVDKSCRDFEKSFKVLIQKKSLEEDIVYLDLKDVSDVSKFFSDVFSNYAYDSHINQYPVMIYFKDATIFKVLGGSDVTLRKVEEFLKEM